MPSDSVQLELAESYAKGLLPVQAPSLCPRCFTRFAYPMERGTPPMPLLQTQCHMLWDAMMKFVTAAWTPEASDAVSRKLRSTYLRCRKCVTNRHELRDALGWKSPLFDMIFDVCCITLFKCLDRDDRAFRREKGFGSKRGRWPTQSEQLFPYGPERTVGALMDSIETRGLRPQAILMKLLALHRPLAFPFVLTHRRRIIAYAIGKLNINVQAATQKVRTPSRSKQEDEVLLPYLTDGLAVMMFLEKICCGPDYVKLEDVRFLAGYEADIFNAMHSAIRLLHAPNKLLQPFVNLAAFLWGVYREKWPNTSVGMPPEYVRIWEQAMKNRFADPYAALRHYLKFPLGNRDCHGPGCGKRVHYNGTARAFQQCARCRLVQYCCKECQRADWTSGGVTLQPHKQICDMLHELLAFTNFDASFEEFSAACRARSYPLDRVDALISWCTQGEVQLDYASSGRLFNPAIAEELLNMF